MRHGHCPYCGEECDAAFTRDLAFDLNPILEAYGPVVIVNFANVDVVGHMGVGDYTGE